MKLINADYLTGRIFTEASLKNAHTCYLTIMAIIESMKSEDVLDKIRAEITENIEAYRMSDWETNNVLADGLQMALNIIDGYREGEQE